MLEFTIWVSSELTCLRAPFSLPLKTHLHTHRLQSYLTHSVASLSLDKPHGYKKVPTVFVFSPHRFFFLTLFHFLIMQSGTHHVQTKQCPHISVVQPQRLGKILSGQLQVFQAPLSVLHLWEEAVTWPISFAKWQLSQWQHDIWTSNTWQACVNISPFMSLYSQWHYMPVCVSWC